jgi:hypothetical protein
MNGKTMLAGTTMMAAAMSAQGNYTPSSYGDLVSSESPFNYGQSNYGGGKTNRTSSSRKLDVSKRNAKRRAQRKARRNNR